MNDHDELEVAKEQYMEVRYSTNGAGQGIYRHVIYTEWTVIPTP